MQGTAQLLPIITKSDQPLVTTPYQTRGHLFEAAVREYLYITIYELLLVRQFIQTDRRIWRSARIAGCCRISVGFNNSSRCYVDPIWQHFFGNRLTIDQTKQ